MNTIYSSKRILSLDVFRGITIVLMILVNSPGNSDPYPLLEHAAWNGFTLADAVFPFFLFIVGLSSVISFNKHDLINQKKLAYTIVIKRSVILFVLGLLLNMFPNHFGLDSIRVFGVLQRIGICYLITGILYLNTRVKTQILSFFAILWGYWFLMTQISVPGFGANQLTIEGNWVSYVDQLFFSSSHLYAKYYDPEGLLSTIPSIATTLIGTLTGTLLLSRLSSCKKVVIMLAIGGLFLVFGWLWNLSFPINKNLWTSSYVLWSGGWALIVLAFCFIIIDVLGYKKWTIPLTILGMNALFIYLVHVLLLKAQFMIHLPYAQGPAINLKLWLTQFLFGNYSNHNAALFYSISFICFNFILAAFLYKHALFIRIINWKKHLSRMVLS